MCVCVSGIDETQTSFYGSGVGPYDDVAVMGRVRVRPRGVGYSKGSHAATVMSARP